MNPIDDAKEPSPSSPAKSNRRRWVTVGVALLMGAAGLWFLMPHSTPPPEVIILPANYSIQPQPMPIPDRWIPMTWGWLWKVRYAVLGRPTSTRLDFKLLRFRERGSIEALLGRGIQPPVTSSNGVTAWVLPEHEMKSLETRLELDADREVGARVYTRPGTLSKLTVTLSNIEGVRPPANGLITCAIRNRGRALELTSSCLLWSVVTNAQWSAPDLSEPFWLETNLGIVATMQIPTRHGVFLYDTNRIDARGARRGVLIRWQITGPPPQASGPSTQPLK